MTGSCLTLINKVPNSDGKGLYKCICGKEVMVDNYKVNSLRTKSCGCMSKQFISERNGKHHLKNHPLYNIWHSMVSRCTKEYASKYEYYGQSGVTVCNEWKIDFKAFYDWAMSNGWERGKQIDKDIIPSKLGITERVYSPEMCCIVTNKENCNKRSTNNVITYKGESKTISQWADSVGVDQKLMRYRILNWGIEKALNTPVLKKGIKKPVLCISNGNVYQSVFDAAKENCIDISILYRVLKGKKNDVNGLTFKYKTN